CWFRKIKTRLLSKRALPSLESNQMDAKDRKAIIEAILNNESDNYLYEYLTQREKQASFSEDRHLEHDGYLASLQKIMDGDTDTKFIIDKFKVRFFLGLYLRRFQSSPSKSSLWLLCDELPVRWKIGLGLAKQEQLMAEKKSTAVSDFWKRINEKQKQREEEKAAVRAASLGHLNIFGQAVRTSTELSTYKPQIHINLVTQDNAKKTGKAIRK
ncbi:2382_t:CDS:2, partial [Paraglomus brasilianum]